MARKHMDEVNEAVAEEAIADVPEEEETSPASAEVAVACQKCGGPTTPYDGPTPEKMGSFVCAPCNYRTRPRTE